MLESLRDKILSVVQDGMTRNNNMRQKLSEVQAVHSNLKYPFSVLNANSKSLPVNYGVGASILEKYEKEWSEMRALSEENATKADRLDDQIVALLASQKKQYVSLTDLSYSLAHLPKISIAVDECTNLLFCLDGLFEEIDNKIAVLEDIIEKQELQQRKQQQHVQLARYKEAKLGEMEKARQRMALQSANAAAQQERELQQRQEERRLACQQAFQDDMEAFKLSGSVGTRVERVAKAADNQMSLEQIELDLNSAELDEFLNG